MKRCCGCGRFVRLGDGKVASVVGREQYFCSDCVKQRLEYCKREGLGNNFEAYIGRKVEMV